MTAEGELALRKKAGAAEVTMSEQRDTLPIVRCPGCDVPMVSIETTNTAGRERLTRVTYECPSCATRTERLIAEIGPDARDAPA